MYHVESDSDMRSRYVLPLVFVFITSVISNFMLLYNVGSCFFEEGRKTFEFIPPK